MTTLPVKDLIALVADKDNEFALRGVLSRPEAAGIRRITCDVFPHPEHDPGCLVRGQDFLRSFRRIYRHAIVVFDREGCGQEELEREQLEAEVERKLRTFWDDRAAAVVIDPELEAWVWSDSPHVDAELGWVGRTPDLRSWLQQQGLLGPRQVKPGKPKKAVREALRAVRKVPSSAIFARLAGAVSFGRCSDPAFAKLLATLQRWFPRDSS